MSPPNLLVAEISINTSNGREFDISILEISNTVSITKYLFFSSHLTQFKVSTSSSKFSWAEEMTTTTASCLCGNLKICFAGEPEKRLLCHCLDCRKISGSNYSDNAIIADENFKLVAGIVALLSSSCSFLCSIRLSSFPIDCLFLLFIPLYYIPIHELLIPPGTPKMYTKTADSGRSIISYFCPDCGSTIYREGEWAPGKKILKTGSVDDPKWQNETEIKGEVWTNTKLKWLPELKNPKA
jgi:hypothetical protein